MKLRKEIEPQFDVAKKHYPEILKLILDYTDFCDENGDEENLEYKILEDKLHRISGKEMSQFNLCEWWEEEGAEVLAFNISLPNPEKTENISKDELYEVIRRLKSFEEPKDLSDFAVSFYINVVSGNGYFMKWLQMNFSSFKLNLFQRNKDKKGKYFEYSIDEVVEILWNNGK
ncbi:hypothetical protein [Flavobacterium anhuiense]|nr:hypothetical protein [Flavobacterium anhuiense]